MAVRVLDALERAWNTASWGVTRSSGAHLPIVCGAAWSAQYRGTDQVAVCFFGDGSVNIGAFHEALNLPR